MNNFKSIIFFFLLLRACTSFTVMTFNPLDTDERTTSQFAIYNRMVRIAVEKRIKKFEETGDKSFLNRPFSGEELECPEMFLITPLSSLIRVGLTSRISNRDMIYQLLRLDAAVTNESMLNAVASGDTPTLLLLLHRNVSKAILNSALRYNGRKINMKLLLSYGAQPNNKNERLETILFDLINSIVSNCNRIQNDVSWKKRMVLLNLKSNLKKIKHVLEFGANPYIQNIEGKTVFDLISEQKECLERSPDVFHDILVDNSFEDQSVIEVKEGCDALTAFLKQSIHKRINRMTDFLHTRASQTPFKVIEIAHKIAEHLYKDDMKITKRDWDKLLGLVKQ